MQRFYSLCRTLGLMVVTLVLACSPPSDSTPADTTPSDPLPSWNDGASKQQILDFVARVTDPNGSDFVPEGERIATFDNDGTLWAENPLYFQLLFAVHRVKALADEHPEWITEQPFKAILEDDRETIRPFWCSSRRLIQRIRVDLPALRRSAGMGVLCRGTRPRHGQTRRGHLPHDCHGRDRKAQECRRRETR